ncbi:MAG: hypothetical protein MPK62_06835, partial [Alphaproteobacteria bacterium]|nr:hypothetical protein [Alphaproteobacteria bacterium]
MSKNRNLQSLASALRRVESMRGRAVTPAVVVKPTPAQEARAGRSGRRGGGGKGAAFSEALVLRGLVIVLIFAFVAAVWGCLLYTS